MGILEVILVAAFSATYVIELTGSLFGLIGNSKLFKHIITPPLAFLACWLLHLVGVQWILASLGVCFISTSLRVLLDAVTSKPVVIPRRM
jgi:hypothetical protein